MKKGRRNGKKSSVSVNSDAGQSDSSLDHAKKFKKHQNLRPNRTALEESDEYNALEEVIRQTQATNVFQKGSNTSSSVMNYS